MMFLRKKITIVYLALAVIGCHLNADDAGYVSRAKQKVRNAGDWSTQVAKESYDKAREKAKNAYAFTCEKTRALYEKAKEHKFITGALAYLAVEGLMKLSGSHTLFGRIFLLPNQLNTANANLNAANNNLNHANNVTIPGHLGTINGLQNTINGNAATIANLNNVVIPRLNADHQETQELLRAQNLQELADMARIRELRNQIDQANESADEMFIEADQALVAKNELQRQVNQAQHRVDALQNEIARLLNGTENELVQKELELQRNLARQEAQQLRDMLQAQERDAAQSERQNNLDTYAFSLAMKNVGQQIDEINDRIDNLNTVVIPGLNADHQEAQQKLRQQIREADESADEMFTEADQALAAKNELQQQLDQAQQEVQQLRDELQAKEQARQQLQREFSQELAQGEIMLAELETSDASITRLTNQKNLAQQELDVLKNQYNHPLNATNQSNWQNQGQQQQLQSLNNQIQNKEIQIRRAYDQGKAQVLLDSKHKSILSSLPALEQEFLNLNPNNPFQVIDSYRIIEPLLQQIQTYDQCHQLAPFAYNDPQQISIDFKDIHDQLMNFTQQTINHIFNHINERAVWLADQIKKIEYDNVTEDNLGEYIGYFYEEVNKEFALLNSLLDQFVSMIKLRENNNFILSCWNALDVGKEESIFKSLKTMIYDSSNSVVDLIANKEGNNIIVGSYKDKFNLFAHTLALEHACNSNEKIFSLYPAHSIQEGLNCIQKIRDEVLNPTLASFDNVDVREDAKPEDFGQASTIQKNEQKEMLDSWMVFASKIDKSMSEYMFESTVSLPVDDLEEVLRLMDEKTQKENEEIDKMLQSSINIMGQSIASNSMLKSSLIKSTFLSSVIGNVSNIQGKSNLTSSAPQFFKASTSGIVPADMWKSHIAAVNADFTKNRENMNGSRIANVGINKNIDWQSSYIASGLYGNSAIPTNADSIIAKEQKNASSSLNFGSSSVTNIGTSEQSGGMSWLNNIRETNLNPDLSSLNQNQSNGFFDNAPVTDWNAQPRDRDKK